MAELKRPKLFFAMVGGFIFLIAGATGFLPAYLKGKRERAELSTPAGAATFLSQDPKTAPLFATIRSHYPDEFVTVTQQIAAVAAAGMTGQQANDQLLAVIRGAMVRHVGELVQAPSAQLVALNHIERMIMSGLSAKDPAVCARYVTTGALHASEIPQDVEDLVSTQKILWWQTAAAGRDKPVGRTVGQLSGADADALRAGMLNGGVSEAEYAAFTSDSGIAGLAPARQCAVAIAAREALAAMPEDAAARVLATMYSTLG